MLAAQRGHLEVVRVLKEGGAALDTQDWVGRLPYGISVFVFNYTNTEGPGVVSSNKSYKSVNSHFIILLYCKALILFY